MPTMTITTMTATMATMKLLKMATTVTTMTTKRAISKADNGNIDSFSYDSDSDTNSRYKIIKKYIPVQ